MGIAMIAFLASTGVRPSTSASLGELVARRPIGLSFHAAFVVGLTAGGLLLAAIAPSTVGHWHPRTNTSLIAAGILVGFGARLAGRPCAGRRSTTTRLVLIALIAASAIATGSALGLEPVHALPGGAR